MVCYFLGLGSDEDLIGALDESRIGPECLTQGGHIFVKKSMRQVKGTRTLRVESRVDSTAIQRIISRPGFFGEGGFASRVSLMSAVFTMPLQIKLVPAGEVLALRAAVLRAHKPVSESLYAEDDAPDTFHVAAYEDGALVGCGTGLRKGHGACPTATYQLRGMAVSPVSQGQGVGRAVLAEFEAEAVRRGAVAVWCNARKTAESFYAGCGWVATGPIFEEVGLPHVVMFKHLSSEAGALEKNERG